MHLTDFDSGGGGAAATVELRLAAGGRADGPLGVRFAVADATAGTVYPPGGRVG